MRPNRIKFVGQKNKDGSDPDIEYAEIVTSYGVNSSQVERGFAIFKHASREIKVTYLAELITLLTSTLYFYWIVELIYDPAFERPAQGGSIVTVEKWLVLRTNRAISFNDDLITVRCDSMTKLLEITNTQSVIFKNMYVSEIVADLCDRASLPYLVDVNQMIGTHDNYVISTVDLPAAGTLYQIVNGDEGRYYIKNYDGTYFNFYKTGKEDFGLELVEQDIAWEDWKSDSVKSLVPGTIQVLAGRNGNSHDDFDEYFYFKRVQNGSDYDFHMYDENDSIQVNSPFDLNSDRDKTRSFFYDYCASVYDSVSLQSYAMLVSKKWTDGSTDYFEIHRIKSDDDDFNTWTSQRLVLESSSTETYQLMYIKQIKILSTYAHYICCYKITDNGTSDVTYRYHLIEHDFDISGGGTITLEASVNDATLYEHIHWVPNNEGDNVFRALYVDMTNKEVEYVTFENNLLSTFDLTIDDDLTDLIYTSTATVISLDGPTSAAYNQTRDEFIFSVGFWEDGQRNRVSFTYSKKVYSYLETFEAQASAAETITELAKLFNCVFAYNHTNGVVFKSRENYFNSAPALTINHYQKIDEDLAYQTIGYVEIGDAYFPLSFADEDARFAINGISLTISSDISQTRRQFLAEFIYDFFQTYRRQVRLDCNLIAQPELRDLNLLDVVTFSEQNAVVVEIFRDEIADSIRLTLLQEK